MAAPDLLFLGWLAALVVVTLIGARPPRRDAEVIRQLTQIGDRAHSLYAEVVATNEMLLHLLDRIPPLPEAGHTPEQPGEFDDGVDFVDPDEVDEDVTVAFDPDETVKLPTLPPKSFGGQW
jgi:hypothetical protein